MTEYRIERYQDSFEDTWDDFVLNRSVNGTFLQTRNFLNYHPKNRFEDASLIIFYKNKPVAVVPACTIKGKEGYEFYSHKGSTFGGIIIKKDFYVAEKLLGIVSSLDEYLSQRYSRATLKITADIFSRCHSDLLQYILFHAGFQNYMELSTYIDLQNAPDNVCDLFDRNKIRNIAKCEEQKLEFRELKDDFEIEQFYELLKINLSKYNLKPIHTVEEIKSFKHERIPENVKFYGVFKDKMEVSGGMMFVFPQTNVIHAQNLSADYRFQEYSPITYMYYRIIKQAKEDGYKALSWGISTENQGDVLNMGLIRNKESYGSKHQLNRTFYKQYEARVM